MAKPDKDPSVFNEPHLRLGNFSSDSTEIRADQIVSRNVPSEAEVVEQSVWDEPGMSTRLAGAAPADAPTFESWLNEKVSTTSNLRSWLVTLWLALAAGPWAVLGALITSLTSENSSAFGAVVLTIIGPVTEEVTKSAAVLWVVEKRPYLFKSRLQIYLAMACGALGFAAIENGIYLTIYIPDPSAEIVAWRWTVCVALHVGCTLLSAMGLAHIWKKTNDSRMRPELSPWFPYLMCAVIVHGTYNGFALIFQLFVGF